MSLLIYFHDQQRHKVDFVLLVYVIGLDAVQFGNNWMRKNLRTGKIGPGRRLSPIWLSEEFVEFNYFQNGQACSPVTIIIIHCSHHLSSHWLKAYS